MNSCKAIANSRGRRSWLLESRKASSMRAPAASFPCGQVLSSHLVALPVRRAASVASPIKLSAPSGEKMGRPPQIEVDPDVVGRMWLGQKGVCAVTGLAMSYPGQRRHPCVATPARSGDRGEARLVCYFVAVLLRSFTILEVRQLLHVAAENARAILQARKEGQAPSSQPPRPPLPIPRDIERQLARALNNSQRRAASRKKLRRIENAHDLTILDMRNMWQQQAGRCAITGVHLVARRGDAPPASMLTIDRIDSQQGYTVANCQLLSFSCNLVSSPAMQCCLSPDSVHHVRPLLQVKSDLSQEDFVQMLAGMRL